MVLTFLFALIFLLTYLFLGIFHVPIFLHHQCYLHSSFPLVTPSCWSILISIPLLATCTVFISPVTMTSRVLHDSYRKIRHLRCTFSFGKVNSAFRGIDYLAFHWPCKCWWFAHGAHWDEHLSASSCRKSLYSSTQMTSVQMSGFRFPNFPPHSRSTVFHSVLVSV